LLFLEHNVYVTTASCTTLANFEKKKKMVQAYGYLGLNGPSLKQLKEGQNTQGPTF
jgi:hypothetical protein